MVKYPLAAILVMAASVSLAQVKVVDSEPTIGAMPPPPAPAGLIESSTQSSSNSSAQLYYQLQILQREVQELRGMLEEQAHELKQLKQQRMDDYLDLDRRLSELQGKDSASVDGSPSAAPAGKDELSDYRAAIDLVLKQQDYDRGIDALKQHLDTYPNGRYAANAQYWLRDRKSVV